MLDTPAPRKKPPMPTAYQTEPMKPTKLTAVVQQQHPVIEKTQCKCFSIFTENVTDINKKVVKLHQFQSVFQSTRT